MLNVVSLSVTVTTAVASGNPVAVAVKVTDAAASAVGLSTAVIATVADALPAGIVTVAGTVALDGFEDVSVTTCSAVVGPVRVTVSVAAAVPAFSPKVATLVETVKFGTAAVSRLLATAIAPVVGSVIRDATVAALKYFAFWLPLMTARVDVSAAILDPSFPSPPAKIIRR